MTDSTVHQGGCLCGAVRYRVTGTPARSVICTCTQCMRQTGSPLPAFVSFSLDRFECVAGTPKSYRASGHATRQFCGDCGSFLFWIGERRGRIGVALGSLDDPSAMPKPDTRIWASRGVSWLGDLAIENVYPESAI